MSTTEVDVTALQTKLDALVGRVSILEKEASEATDALRSEKESRRVLEEQSTKDKEKLIRDLQAASRSATEANDALRAAQKAKEKVESENSRIRAENDDLQSKLREAKGSATNGHAKDTVAALEDENKALRAELAAAGAEVDRRIDLIQAELRSQSERHAAAIAEAEAKAYAAQTEADNLRDQIRAMRQSRVGSRSPAVEVSSDPQGESESLIALSNRVCFLEALLEEASAERFREVARLEAELGQVEQLYLHAARRTVMLPAQLLCGSNGAVSADLHWDSSASIEGQKAARLLEAKEAELEARIAQLAFDEENLCVFQARLKGKEQKLADWAGKLEMESANFNETVKQLEQQLLIRERSILDREEHSFVREAKVKEAEKEFERHRREREEELLQLRSRLAKEEDRLQQQFAVLSDAHTAPPIAADAPTNGGDSAASKLSQLESQISTFDRQIHALHVKRLAATGQRQFLLSRASGQGTSFRRGGL